jgi:hypothetical protein
MKIIKQVFRKIFNKIFLRNLDDIKVQKGKIFEQKIQEKLNNFKNLNEVYFKVFSQDFEDGILQYLLKSLKILNVKFVEIGTQDYSESNTRYIFETMRCDGLIIDPYPNLKKKVKSFCKIWQNNLKIHNNYINSKNINKTLKKYSFDKDIDIFSVDIDGIDYWILNEIKPKISKIFIVEYNPYFGPQKEITAPNINKFDRFEYHYSGFCWGASLKAIINLMKRKGYYFIGTNRLNCNAFFILKELINKINIKLPNTKNLKDFTDAKFIVLKDKNNKNTAPQNIKNDLSKVIVYDLKKKILNSFEKIKN